MGLMGLALAFFLFIFLAVMTLMINPPEAWTRKWTGGDGEDKPKDKKNR